MGYTCKTKEGSGLQITTHLGYFPYICTSYYNLCKKEEVPLVLVIGRIFHNNHLQTNPMKRRHVQPVITMDVPHGSEVSNKLYCAETKCSNPQCPIYDGDVLTEN